MKKITFFLLLCLVAITTGCPKTTPVRPEVVTKIANYQIAQLDIDTAKYECAVNGETFIEQTLTYKDCGTNAKDLDKARKLRNEVIYRLIRITDYNYFQFENDLYVKRTSGSFLADVTDIGANFAATISNGERAKTIINAAIIAFRGGRRSGSLNFFREQTAEILITNMQTSRNRVLVEMLTQLRDSDVNAYSLDAGLGDVIKYFYAGTLPRALQELQRSTSQAAREAREDVRSVKGLVEPGLLSKEKADFKVESSNTLRKLAAALNNPNDQAAALQRLKNIVKQLENDLTLKADLMSKNNVTSMTEDGAAIIAALRAVKRDKSDAIRGDNSATDTLNEKALATINEAIVKFGKLSELEDN